ncbi:RNI-like protein [Gonapodya prolifera JEL478]|uniref:RNI-like protein n=1 Tax=Gonapodya prolifera (strain JEL478) TaxID=1344416 RepID=A0A138ZWR8_GONPJ|nr:RNI-like protein [Gonapodya prolifera JEL478]|eukprot:KXS08928.1 RNI-like protein [Gonapodya prolifera JEL478]
MSQTPDCTPFEQLFNQSGLPLLWKPGDCCSVNPSSNWYNPPAPAFNCSSGRIKDVWLYGLGLRAPISNISVASELRILDLSNNQLTGNVQWLANLTQLERIDLGKNQFMGEIPDLSATTQLYYLDLSLNNIDGQIPLSWGFNLYHLNLSFNKISGPVPYLLKNNVTLQVLDLSSNILTGTIPPLSSFKTLYTLNLSRNHLTGTIPYLQNAPGSSILDLSDNNLTGVIPKLGEGFTTVNLSHNSLTGPVPASVYGSYLENLEILDLSNNQLSGTISAYSKSLSILNLSRNQLTGSIPTWTPEYFQNITLDLSHNQFSGNVKDLTSFSELQLVDLSYNQLSGAPPKLPQYLRYVALDHNHFSGSIPPLYGYERLTNLDLSFNNFSGNLDNLLKLPALMYCRLGSNPGLYSCNGSLPSVCNDTASPIVFSGACINPSDSISGPKTAAIAGGVIGGVVGVAILIVGLARYRRGKAKNRRSTSNLDTMAVASEGIRKTQPTAPRALPPQRTSIAVERTVSPDSKMRHVRDLRSENNSTEEQPRNSNKNLDDESTHASLTRLLGNLETPVIPLSSHGTEPPSKPLAPPPLLALPPSDSLRLAVPSNYNPFRDQGGSGQPHRFDRITSNEIPNGPGLAGEDEHLQSLVPHWAFTALVGTMLDHMPRVDLPLRSPPLSVEHDYVPTNPDELAAARGDLVKLKTVFRDGWGIGLNVVSEAVGLIPLDCLRIAPSQPNFSGPPTIRLESVHLTGSGGTPTAPPPSSNARNVEDVRGAIGAVPGVDTVALPAARVPLAVGSTQRSL